MTSAVEPIRCVRLQGFVKLFPGWLSAPSDNVDYMIFFGNKFEYHNRYSNYHKEKNAVNDCNYNSFLSFDDIDTYDDANEHVGDE